MRAQQLLRTILFVPGNKPSMLDKARTLPADAVILDLEDGVPPGEKSQARSSVRQALGTGSYAPYVILRINAFRSGLAEEDLQQAFSVGVRAVCLPKAETEGDIERLTLLLDALEGKWELAAGATRIFLMIETALGVLNAYKMARSSSRVHALCLGGEDLTRDLGAVRTREGQELTHARAQMVLAARATGALAIDTIYTKLADLDGLLIEACQARQLGYSGKLIIHPAQVEPVHRAFAPTQEEIAHAHRILEEFEAAQVRGNGVIALDGQMVDAPVVERARELLLLAEKMQARE